MQVIVKGRYVANVDLLHAYWSVHVHPVNYPTLGLKWHFSGHKHVTCLVGTQKRDRLLI